LSDASKGKVSRRKFVAGTVGGLAVGAVLGVAGGYLGAPNKTTTETATQVNTATQTMTSTVQPWLPSTWDQTADVVVVGFGGAGAVSAIQAHNSGANVIILEKMTQALAGGNTSVSGGIIFTPSPAADAVIYLNAMSEGYTIPQDMVQNTDS
jgi:D-arabinose 1-dehydrogenase-like Zn-dependent alcohol dehydrogenase